MNDLSWINFNQLPSSTGGFSNLYIDFLNDFRKVHQFYEMDFHSLQAFSSHAENISSRYQRNPLVSEVLSEQNQLFGAGSRALQNIQYLDQQNTLAIVTGQQVGICGGPLYSVYKIITVLKLVDKLSESYPSFKFIPVFWLEGEDHDFNEVSAIGLLDSDHQPKSIDYQTESGKRANKNIGAVGEIVLDASIQSFIEHLQKTFQNSEFKRPLVDFLQNIYTPGITFNVAFARLMNKLFEDSGLIFISINDRRLKKILSPIFKRELQEYPKVSQGIINKSAELEARYHAQIKPKALNLFFFHNNGRYLIEPREHDFMLKGTRQYFQKEEMLRIAEETPELFSPNVALRPICQDTILPTLVYVGGPSEIAYFAQLKPVYALFDIVMPIIYPRASATIVEEKSVRILEKYQLDLLEIFKDRERLNRKIIDLISEVKIDEMFDEATKRTDELIAEMKYGINYIDSTLMGPLESTREKIKSYLDVLKDKIVEAQKRKHDIALRQMAKVYNLIFPNDNFQERELSIIYFMNKYGLDFIKRLQSEIQIDKFMHQMIKV